MMSPLKGVGGVPFSQRSSNRILNSTLKKKKPYSNIETQESLPPHRG